MSTTMTADDLQRWVAQRIADALGTAAEEIDVTAPFTDHGLDSVAALSMTAELEELLQRPVSATLLWEYPTIASLAQHLAGGG